MPNAVTHDELNRLIALLLPADPARDQLAEASAEANAAAARLNAELATTAARAAFIARAIIAGVPDITERNKLARERGQIETEKLFTTGRLSATTRAQASCELQFLAYLYRTAQDGLRAAMDAHDAAFNAWKGPARRDALLRQDTRPEHAQEREAVAVTLAPLARRGQEATEHARHWQLFKDMIDAFTVTRYGPEVNLAAPSTFDAAISRIADRAAARYRATVAA